MTNAINPPQITFMAFLLLTIRQALPKMSSICVVCRYFLKSIADVSDFSTIPPLQTIPL